MPVLQQKFVIVQSRETFRAMEFASANCEEHKPEFYIIHVLAVKTLKQKVRKCVRKKAAMIAFTFCVVFISEKYLKILSFS